LVVVTVIGAPVTRRLATAQMVKIKNNNFIFINSFIPVSGAELCAFKRESGLEAHASASGKGGNSRLGGQALI
jgi:hypothetical protein